MIKKQGTPGFLKLSLWGFFLYIFLSTQNLIPLHAVFTDVLMMCLVLVAAFVSDWQLMFRKDKAFHFGIIHFVLPVLVIFAYSTFNQLVRGLSRDFLTHGITIAVRYTAYYVVGFIAVSAFGKKSVDYMLYMGMLAYIPAFIEHLQEYGVVGGIAIMFNPKIFHIQTPLEIHTLTYIFGFLALYYAYMWLMERQKNYKWHFFISLLLTVTGTKRIVLAALAGALFIMLVLDRIQPSQRYTLLTIGCFAMVALSFVYMWLIHSGILESTFVKLGIDPSSRFQFWNYFADRYSLDLSFLGYGLSYCARVVQHEYMYMGLAWAVNIHNDIMRVYLGLGFIGAGLYWLNYFNATVRGARLVGDIKAATFVFSIAAYFFINSMVCNEGINPITNGMYFTIIYAVICHSYYKKINHKERGEADNE